MPTRQCPVCDGRIELGSGPTWRQFRRVQRHMRTHQGPELDRWYYDDPVRVASGRLWTLLVLIVFLVVAVVLAAGIGQWLFDGGWLL